MLTTRTSFSIWLIAAGYCVMVLAPARATAAPAAKASPRGATKNAVQPASLDDHPLVKSLAAVESGPGVVLFEPVSAGAPELRQFGAGCGRWLNLAVGGQPEFGKTPLWDSADEVRRELKLADMALPLADAGRIGRSLGCTHVGVGDVKGDMAHCTLTYQLYTLTPQAPLGAATVLSGTAAEVTARLPEAARTLAAQLGVRQPHVPEAIGETADELRQLGSVPWKPGNNLDNASLRILNQTALSASSNAKEKRPGRPVLGALLDAMFFSTTEKSDYTQAVAQNALRNLPQNSLVLAEGLRAWVRGGAKQPEQLPSESLQTLRAAHPHNYLLCLAQSYSSLIADDLPAARAASAEAVRCNRANSRAWLGLARVIGGQAQQVRRGRIINALTPSELKTCTAFYTEEIVAALKCVKTAPDFALGWVEVSSTAAALGDEKLADEAYRKAEALEPGSSTVLWWGLQLYQPKWLDQPARLKHVGVLAVSAAKELGEDDCWSLARGLAEAGMVAEAQKLVRSDDDREALRQYIENLKNRQ